MFIDRNHSLDFSLACLPARAESRLIEVEVEIEVEIEIEVELELELELEIEVEIEIEVEPKNFKKNLSLYYFLDHP